MLSFLSFIKGNNLNWDPYCLSCVYLCIYYPDGDGVQHKQPRLDWFPCPNVGQASTNRNLRLYPGVCFSCIVTNLHLSVI